MPDARTHLDLRPDPGRAVRRNRRQHCAWLLVGLFATPSALAAAQGPGRAGETGEPVSQTRIDRRADGTVEVTGDRFTAAFGAHGVRFVQRGVDGREAAMSWRAVAAGRGAASTLLPVRTPTVDGQQVSYDRGPCVERYAVLLGGLEQSFVFDALPTGEGDLVVRLEVTTDLPLTAAGPDGLCFGADERHGVRWGGVTGIAADGRRAVGTITSDGASIELRLPERFVAGAALPLVLDPLIGATFQRFASGAGIFFSLTGYERPDVTTRSWTDATGFVAMSVWGSGLLGQGYWVEVGRVQADGSFGGQSFPALNDARNPAIASIPFRDRYVVVAESLAGDIVAASFDPFGLNGAIVTAAGGADVQEAPDIGGELTTVDDDMVVVFRNATQDRIQALQLTVSATGGLNPAGLTTLATAGPANNYLRPRISKTGGTVGRYLITYEDYNVLTGSRTVRAIAVTRNLTVLGSVSLGAGRNQDVDGNGDEWVVAFERTGTGGDRDVYATPVRWSTSTATLTAGAATAVSALTSTNETDPAVAWLGSSALVGWSRAAPGATDTDLFVKTVDAFTCAQCEPAQLLANSLRPERHVGLAGAPGYGPGGHALVAYEIESTNASIAPYGDGMATAFVAEDGQRADIAAGVGCGSGGRTTFSCARVGNSGFEVRLRSARPAATSWLVLSPFATQLGCGGCTLVVDPFGGFVSGALATDASGDASLPISIPNSGALVGASLVAQWIVTAPAGAGGCALLGTDFSTGLRIRID